MFAAEYEPLLSEPRRRGQRPPAGTGDAESPGAMVRALCRVVDISRNGCRLQTYSVLRRGIAIRVTFPGGDQADADVIWVNDFVASCNFRHPLRAAAIATMKRGADAAVRARV